MSIYYSKCDNLYFENEDMILRYLAFKTDGYINGKIRWQVKERKAEVLPNGIVCAKKTFIMSCLSRSQSKITQTQITVLILKSKPKDQKYYTVESCLRKRLDGTWLTDYGKQYYQQVLEHFIKNPTFEDIKNHLFFEKTP